MKVILYLQRSKGKKLKRAAGKGICAIDCSKERRILAFQDRGDQGAQCVALMDRVRIEFIGADGMMLSGFEEDSRDPTNNYFQQWWCQSA